LWKSLYTDYKKIENANYDQSDMLTCHLGST
jgi:hypothetical protein